MTRSRRRGVAAGLVPWLRVVGVLLAGGALVAAAGPRIPQLDLAERLGHHPAEEASAIPVADPLLDRADVSCVGPELMGLADSQVPEQHQSVQVRAASVPGEGLPAGVVRPSAGSLQVRPVPTAGSAGLAVPADPAATQVTTREIGSSEGVTFLAEGGAAVGLSGVQWYVGTQDEVRGLELGACPVAQDEVWLIGGGGEPGRSERLVLVNPGANPVTVQVEVLGAQGRHPATGGSSVVVAPGDRKVVLLDALAVGETRPVVQLTSTGGAVVAALGDRWLEGTVDRGMELTTAAAPPATHLVIPAVPRPDKADSGRSLVRIGVPGNAGAVVNLRALTPRGPLAVGQEVTTVAAGAVVDVNLDDLPSGTSALELSSDVPVVAAAQVERRKRLPGPADVAWVSASEPITTVAGTALPTATRPRIEPVLTLASVTGAEVDVIEVVAGSVRTHRVQVPPAGVASRELSPAQSVWVRSVSGEVYGAVIATSPTGRGPLVAGMTLQDLPLERDVVAIAPWRP